MNKKTMSIAVFTAFVVVMSSLSVYAGGQGGEDGFSAKWKERMEERKQELFKELNLTDEQKSKLEENRKKNKEGSSALWKSMKDLRNAMRQELEKETLDMAKINQIQSQMKEAHAQMMDNRLQSILEVRGILTPEQFRKFSAKMQEHKERSFKKRWDKEKGDKTSSEDSSRMNPSADSPDESEK